jgi:hypothetical protein
MPMAAIFDWFLRFFNIPVGMARLSVRLFMHPYSKHSHVRGQNKINSGTAVSTIITDNGKPSLGLNL